MRISDWSSDVFSSDLSNPRGSRSRCHRDTIPYAPTTNRHGRFGGASFGEDVTGAGMVSAFIGGMVVGRRTGGWVCWRRWAEHKSELQSLIRISYAALCLKTNQTHIHTRSHNIDAL